MDNSKKNKLGSLSKEQLQLLLKKRAAKETATKVAMPKMPVNSAGEYPLSNSQERMWFLEQLNEGSVINNNPVYAFIEVDEEFNLPVMENVVKEIIKRHDAFRTSFIHKEGVPLQKIHASVPFQLDFHDLSILSKEDREEFIKTAAFQEALQNIPLSEAPLFRLRILKTQKLEYLFLFTPHHIISDGWSNQAFLKELFNIYISTSKIGHHRLPEVKYQFIDYVNWEKEWLKTEDYKTHIQYWKKLLTPIPETLKLPVDKKRPSLVSGKGKMVAQKLFVELTNAINEFCLKNDITTFNAFFSALNILLHRLSEQNYISVGVPVANRGKAEFQNIIGLFLNTLPYVTNIEGGNTYFDVLEKVKIQSENNLKHQQLPFDKILTELNLERNLQVPPLFQVLFVFQNIPSLYSVGNLLVRPYKVDVGLAKNDLNFWVEEYNGQFVITLTGNTDIFSLQKIESILNYYALLLESVIANPDVKVAEINFIPEEETAAILNLGKFKKPTDNFVSRFKKSLSECIEKPALEFRDQEMSYRQLEIESNKLANYIAEKNTGNKPVAILLDRGIEMIVSILAVMKSGVPYVPIDTKFPQARIAYILNDCGAKLVLVNSKHKALTESTGVSCICLDEDSEQIQSARENFPEKEIQPDDFVYIIYTSGTTGNPKGVAVPHSSLMNYIDGVTKRIRFEKGSRFATVSTIAADLGNTMIFPSLLLGGRLLIVDDDQILSNELFSQEIKDKPIDYLKVVPSHLTALMKGENNILPQKAIVLGGETLTPELVNAIQKQSPELKIFNHYGPTESTIGVSTYEVKGDETEIPVGKPIDNCSLLVLDKNLNIMPYGVEGDLYIGGESLAAGYLNNDELTKERFIKNPFAAEDRLYKTGDRAILQSDGNVLFRGRQDRQIKIRGNRIELQEIEAALEKQEAIEKAVLLIPSSTTLNQLWASITLNQKITVAETLKQLKIQLPSYMVPDRIFILDNIPVTANGKIDYAKLLKANLELFNQVQNRVEEEPLNETEETIRDIFCKVLKTGSAETNKSFFELGGNSLNAVELLYHLNQTFKLKLPLSFLFQNSSIKSIAESLNAGHEFSHLVQLKKGNNRRHLFLVHPAGGNVFCYKDFATLLDANVSVYGIQSKIGDTAHQNIQALASDYINEIEKLYLNGEITFGGWSMGALVAYEMAVQLKEKRGENAKVLIIDQMALSENPVFENLSETDRIVVFAEKVEQLIGERINITHKKLKGLSKVERSMLFLEVFQKYKFAPENIGINEFHGFLEQMIHHNEISMNYQPPKYDGEVIMIRSENPLVLQSGNSAYGDDRPADLLWKQFADRVTLTSAPGNHVSMMGRPFIEEMMVRLNKFFR